MLPKLVLKPFLLFYLFPLCIAAQPATIRILQFNIWQEGTVVPGGFDAIIAEIIASRADVITFSEVRNYKGVKFNERVVAALKAKNKTYYSFLSYDSGILSKFPILEHAAIMPEKEDHGSVFKAIIKVNQHRVAVYTAHLDYLNAANYPPRGYDGNTWEKTSREGDTAAVLKMNLASKRDEAAALILQDAAIEKRKKALVFVGGDFNEPSHLDWSENTKDLFDHNGMVIPWHTSLAFRKAGFKDAYRSFYPNVLTHPGFTFPAWNKDVPIKKLVWAPDADDRDRIDFIYYLPDSRLLLQKVLLLGPRDSIVKGVPVPASGEDIFIAPKGTWPSDHKAILATFKIK